MKKIWILTAVIFCLAGLSLFGGGVNENTTYARTILERRDSVSTYFQQVVQPFTLKNGPLQLTAVPLLSETYVLSEYPDMKNKRYSTPQMASRLELQTKALDRQQEMSGIFLVFLRYERNDELIGSSSFTIDPRFFEYMFLDNDKGDFLRVGNHPVVRAKKVDAYNEVLEFWVTFGENEEERRKFFQGSETVYISVTDFGFEGKVISYKLPISGMFQEMPTEPKEVLLSIRSGLRVAFNGADTPDLTGQTFGSVIGEPAKPSRKGYSFEGWYNDAQYGLAWDFKNDVLLDDMTLYAKWRVNDYSVTLDSQGGSGGTGSITVGYGASMPSASAPTRSGYIFDGYFDDMDGRGTAYYSDTMESLKTWDKSEPVKLYAKWIRLKSVKFDSSGGSSINPISNISPGSTIAEPAIPYKKGYVFEGWYKDTGYSIPWDFESDKILSDMILYANWRDYYIIGDVGPAGGVIFYDKGSNSDGWRYLEAASASHEFSEKVWGGMYITVKGTETAIGTGKSNTEQIVARFGNSEPHKFKADYAAKVCADLVVIKDGVTYDDWFLPSKDELMLYYDLSHNLRGNYQEVLSESGYYWSSSEYSGYYAWLQNFRNGGQNANSRDLEFRVIPVRAF